jgi:tetratricopeptide (TPR) repeat protein
VHLTHHYGTTTFSLGLDTESPLYWKNIAYFNDKWDIQAYSEEELQSKEGVDQLIALDAWVNPLYPEPSIQEKFEALLTEELRTKILETDYDPETLFHLIHLLMVMEKRDVLRRLEDRIDDMEMPADLIYEMARFYFKRNVYSRCEHYLNRLTERQESLQSYLYRLAMLIDEKKMEEAVPLLTELLEKAPSNPLLYKLGGDVHSFEGNSEEADSFYSLAYQINPFEFEEASEEVRVDL